MSKGSESPVTFTVPEFIIDLFEAVQIEEYEGCGNTLACAQIQALLCEGDKASSVGYPGQIIQGG